MGEEGAGDEEARIKGGPGDADLKQAAELIGCDAAALTKALCYRTVKVGRYFDTTQPHNQERAWPDHTLFLLHLHP